MLLMDSKSETEVEDVCGDDASNSDANGVSISSIALLGEKHGVEEDRAASPADHQVSASKEIYWSCSSDVNNILSTAPLPAAALLSDVDGDFKNKSGQPNITDLAHKVAVKQNVVWFEICVYKWFWLCLMEEKESSGYFSSDTKPELPRDH
ncbi:hypothetical protein SASPL_126977 [Salvia splendens]|uniref:Uncharacterized protein n=1 Tax=Salvia splendens TaxID=180675 RepID=A0A8X8XJT4_SALSN|nr:hypothetical protein SASPL_126977 [Salvia splendens]